MPLPQVPAVRMAIGQGRITIGIAALTWGLTWLVGNVVGATVVGASGHDPSSASTPVWVTLLAALGLWTPMLVGLWQVSRRVGVGTFAADYGWSFALRDLLGVPIGVLTQLVLVPLVYWPLTEAWPDAFSTADREENARTLWDSANGAWLVVLVLIVVIGAPVVEELMYRGLLQGSFVRRVDDGVALVAVALWFAIIHFRPVEYPGLFVVGLVLGGCALATRRLGLGIVAHCAFNATGLVWVATR